MNSRACRASLSTTAANWRGMKVEGSTAWNVKADSVDSPDTRPAVRFPVFGLLIIFCWPGSRD